MKLKWQCGGTRIVSKTKETKYCHYQLLVKDVEQLEFSNSWKQGYKWNNILKSR